MLEQFVKDCLPRVGPHARAGEDCEEEGTAETTCDELTATHIPRPPVPLGENVENLGVKLRPARKEDCGEGVFKTWFYFSSSYSDLIGDKLN